MKPSTSTHSWAVLLFVAAPVFMPAELAAQRRVGAPGAAPASPGLPKVAQPAPTIGPAAQRAQNFRPLAASPVTPAARGGFSRGSQPAISPTVPGMRPSGLTNRPGGRPGGVVRPFGTEKPQLPIAKPTEPAVRPMMPPTRPGGSALGAGSSPFRPGGTSRPVGPVRPGGATRPGGTPFLAGEDTARPGIVSGRPNNLIGGGADPLTRPGHGHRPTVERPSGGNARPLHPVVWPPSDPEPPMRPGERPAMRPVRPATVLPDANPNPAVVGDTRTSSIHRDRGSTVVSFRPGWRPDWGLGPDGCWGPGWSWGPRTHWPSFWVSRHLRPCHRRWFHGVWHSRWSGVWCVPLCYGFSPWGLSVAYANPFCLTYSVTFFDYTQPVHVAAFQAPLQIDAPLAGVDEMLPLAAEPPEAEQALQNFDAARELFSQGAYADALLLAEEAIRVLPNDPVLHEFAALTLFAQGEFGRAAVILHALLSVAPGMDWATMSGLYANLDDYTRQLRHLEAWARQNTTEASGWFVLAYHYLVMGHGDAAAKALTRVTQLQPTDRVAQHLLDALQTSEPPAEPGMPPLDPPGGAALEAAPEPSAEGSSLQIADLVGNWRGERGEDRLLLRIEEDMTFSWHVTTSTGSKIEVSGIARVEQENLVLESPSLGHLVARVRRQSPDAFQFLPPGGAAEDEGVVFERVAAE